MKCLIPLITFIVTGCSLYQSEGRKFLENEGLEFAQLGQNFSAYTDHCAQLADPFREPQNVEWLELDLNSKQLGYFAWKTTHPYLVVQRGTNAGDWLCAFSYANESEFETLVHQDLQTGFGEIERLAPVRID